MTGGAGSAAADVERLVAEKSGRITGERQRRIVSFVEARGRTVTIDELADAVADWEAEWGLTSDWEQIHLHLYEVDLPMLDDAGVVAFDPDEGVVSTHADVVDDWRAETATGRRRREPMSAVRAVGVGLGLVAAVAWLRPATSTSSLGVLWATATLLVLTATLVFEPRHRRRLVGR
jgi:hypothetical protein